MNETDAARLVASGELKSPYKFSQFYLVALRVTGTGHSRRDAIKEEVFRPESAWLRPETLARMAGVPVVLAHPKKKTLDASSYADSNVGALTYAYVGNRDGFADDAGEDAWAIARIYEPDVIEAMKKHQFSTSPGVAFRPSDGNKEIDLGDGTHLLVEGSPSLLDHLAVVEKGVWDKGEDDEPGVRIDNVSNKGETHMTEEEQKAADKARKDAESGANDVGAILGKIGDCLDSIGVRLAALEAERDDAATRKDGEDNARAAKELAEKGNPRRSDSEKRTEEQEDRIAMADEQMRVDGVYRALGQQAPFPMAGETVGAYRVRSHRGIQTHSKKWKGTELHKLPADALGPILEEIRHDAIAYAQAPNDVPAGQLRAITRVDPSTGSRITSFYGQNTFIKTMSQPGRRARLNPDLIKLGMTGHL